MSVRLSMERLAVMDFIRIHICDIREALQKCGNQGMNTVEELVDQSFFYDLACKTFHFLSAFITKYGPILSCAKLSVYL